MKTAVSSSQIKPEYHKRAAEMYMPPEYSADMVRAKRLRLAQLMQEADEEKTKEAAHAAAASSTAASRTVRPLPALAPAPALAAPRMLSKAEQANAAVAYSKAHSVSVVQALKTLGFAS